MGNEQNVVEAKEIRVRALNGNTYLDKKIEQELKELLEMQQTVIKQIEEVISKLNPYNGG